MLTPQADGLDASFAGIPLARLLWFVTPRQAVSLLAAMLLERRVVLTAEDPGKVALAVHAAAALLHPFEWQHVYLPLLPEGLKVCEAIEKRF